MIAIDIPLNENEKNTEAHNMSLSGNIEGNNQHTSKDQLETKYQCPMNCEGNKTYNQPGVCPVCNMALVMVGLDEPRIRVE